MIIKKLRTTSELFYLNFYFLIKLLITKYIPAIKNGLCASVYTQVSDVEDEINGILTYDRKICKLDGGKMRRLADKIYKEIV